MSFLLRPIILFLFFLGCHCDLYKVEYGDWWPGSTSNPQIEWFYNSQVTQEAIPVQSIFDYSSLNFDTYSYYYYGHFIPPITDLYTFKLTSDDNSALYINKDLAIDNMGASGAHSEVTVESSPQNLTVGEYHTIDI